MNVKRVVLVPHASTPCAAVETIEVELELESPGVLAVRWRIVGDIAALHVPEAALDPDRLWEHTCVELFVASAADDAYVEWNFSPTGQVAMFAFSSYRTRAPAPDILATPIGVDARARELRIDARVPIRDGAVSSPTAVIEDAAGTLSYWAVHHPAEKPDFHHRAGFVVTPG